MSVYVRCVGDDQEPRAFATFAPKCINLIGCLHPTLHDRAITIRLQRKLKDQLITSLHRFSGADLQRQCARWVADHRARIESADPDLPQALFNRTADNWRPLVTLADLAGGHWAERVRAAIVAALASNDEDEAAGAMLLADVRAMFKDTGATKMSSSALVESLHGLKERPWSEYGKPPKPITTNRVARLLKPFGIKPAQIWEDDKNTRGYDRVQFVDTFRRYLPEEGVDQSARPLEPNAGAGLEDYQSARTAEILADEKTLKPKRDAGSSGLADQKPPSWETRL